MVRTCYITSSTSLTTARATFRGLESESSRQIISSTGGLNASGRRLLECGARADTRQVSAVEDGRLGLGVIESGTVGNSLGAAFSILQAGQNTRRDGHRRHAGGAGLRPRRLGIDYSGEESEGCKLGVHGKVVWWTKGVAGRTQTFIRKVEIRGFDNHGSR